MSEETMIPMSALSEAERSTAKLNDFSDRLPPMLVKELRQGLRARTFVGVFLGLQLFLGVVMLFATTASGLDGAGEAVSRIIFLFFSLAVLVVQPLRSINALHTEIKSTTLDMMVLTRLNARRIVAGKWASIVGQTLLLFVSIVPYLILRYFFGGMNLFAELLALGSIFLFSACLTAFNVGLSSNAAIIVRGIVPLIIAVFIFGFLMAMVGEFDDFLEFFTLADPDSIAIYWGLLLGSVYLAWIVFGIGVSAIAPAAENHSSLNRIVTLVMMAIAGLILYLAHADAIIIPFIIGAVAFPGLLASLTEANGLLPRVTLPFVRRGAVGKFFGLFLYPCWTSGVHFSALLCLLVLAIGGFVANTTASYRFGEEEFVVLCSLIGSALFPALFLAFFQKRIQNRLGLYLAILIASFGLMLALVAVAESTNADSSMWLFAWLPPVHLYLIDNAASDTVVMMTSLVVTSLYMGILLIHAWSRYKVVRQAEKEASETYLTPEGESRPS
ncbi:MAG: hypothetical protein ACOVRB_05710 [Akkermansiaceae bacterium]